MLEGNELINLVENPSVFHIESSSFPRNLIKKSSASSFCESENGDSFNHEKVIFLERNGKDEKAHEHALFAVPEDRWCMNLINISLLLSYASLPWGKKNALDISFHHLSLIFHKLSSKYEKYWRTQTGLQHAACLV